MVKLTSKPDPGSIGTGDNGTISEGLQVFLDDVEQRLNSDLFGIGAQNIVYIVADLPVAGTQGLEPGMQTYVTDEATLGTVPVWFDGTVWRCADGNIAT